MASHYKKVKNYEDFSAKESQREKNQNSRLRDFAEMEAVSKLPPVPKSFRKDTIDPRIEE